MNRPTIPAETHSLALIGLNGSTRREPQQHGKNRESFFLFSVSLCKREREIETNKLKNNICRMPVVIRGSIESLRYRYVLRNTLQ